MSLSKIVLVIFAVVASLAFGANLRTETGSCQISEYILALQDDCGFESIHGLWPDPESSCTSCTTEVFSESKLTSQTLSDMNKYWPTCQSGSNSDFWSHEWSKHGTCTGMSQEAYFSQAISLYQKYKTNCKTDCYICLTPTFGYEGVC
jgi:ribonuclease I